MAFIIENSNGDTLLTGATPLDMTTGGVYYFKRCKFGSPRRKIAIDSSPSAKGSFAQDFDDHSWPITGGSILLNSSSVTTIKQLYESYSLLIANQIGLELTIPDGVSATYPNCVCTMFEAVRRPDGRTVVPNGDGSLYRMYIEMEFLQLSK